jgi:hypothetical protein
VRLEPLSPHHVPDLAIAGKNESIWAFMRYGPITTETEMQRFVNNLLTLQERGADLPFTVVHLESGKAIGMTRSAHRGEHRV